MISCSTLATSWPFARSSSTSAPRHANRRGLDRKPQRPPQGRVPAPTRHPRLRHPACRTGDHPGALQRDPAPPGIGYVTPNDEHQGRGEAIRKARQAGLETSRLRRLAGTTSPPDRSTPCPGRDPSALAARPARRTTPPTPRTHRPRRPATWFRRGTRHLPIGRGGDRRPRRCSVHQRSAFLAWRFGSSASSESQGQAFPAFNARVAPS
jgi:hypothetical protein